MTIELSEERIKAGLLDSLEEHPDIINVEGQTVTIINSVMFDEGVHDIEMSLFYTLDAGRYGVADYECLKTT